MRLHFTLALLLVLASTRFATAEIMVAPTLEWLADHCIELGVYRVSVVEKKSDTVERYRVKLALKQALRGAPQDTVEELYYQFEPEADSDRPIVNVGDDFLLFFQHLGDGERIASQLINLSNPQQRGPAFIAVTSDFKLLDERMAILGVVRNRLKRRPKGDPVQCGDRSKDNRIELRPEKEPYAAIYAGSTCYLNMPKDLLPK
jgi:hypothetical protein